MSQKNKISSVTLSGIGGNDDLPSLLVVTDVKGLTISPPSVRTLYQRTPAALTISICFYLYSVNNFSLSIPNVSFFFSLLT